MPFFNNFDFDACYNKKSTYVPYEPRAMSQKDIDNQAKKEQPISMLI
jgi:hypothetical protein